MSEEELSSLRQAAEHIAGLEEELSRLRRLAYEFGWVGIGSLEGWLRRKL
jgi:hypothetical protein